MDIADGGLFATAAHREDIGSLTITQLREGSLLSAIVSMSSRTSTGRRSVMGSERVGRDMAISVCNTRYY